MLLSPIMLLLMLPLAYLLVDLSTLPVTGLIAGAVVLVWLCAVDIYLGWRAWKPALIIRRDSLTVNHFIFLHSVVLDWDRIEGMTEEKVPIIGRRSMARFKIAYWKSENKKREILVAPHNLENGDAAVALLKKVLPMGISAQGGHKLEQLRSASLNQYRYKGLELDEQGITAVSPVTREKKVILWERIVRLTADGPFDGSRAMVALHLEFAGGASSKRLTLRGVESYEFIEFIKLLMGRVRREAIDPRLFQLIQKPVSVGNIDTGVALLIISGFILALAGLVILFFYPPTITSHWIYPLLLIPLCLFPFVYTIKLQMEAGEGSGRKKFKSRMAALSFNLGTFVAIVILFLLSPASFSWLLADAHATMGDLKAAETHYLRAEKDLSANADFLFAFGQYYYKTQAWGQAADYYIRAYEKDPDNWVAEPLEKIPDALYRAARTGEALEWCDAILDRYAKRGDVVKVISKKRMEIAKHTDR